MVPKTVPLRVRMSAAPFQVDCDAGVWAHSTAERQLLEQGDVEEGLGAAAAADDDRLQRMGGGRAVPESFTYGSSEQRQQWFRRRLESGRLDAYDTLQMTRRIA
jgi:hypothetical protein